MASTTTFLPPFNLPTPILLLITDELASPADFLLHRSLHQQLKLASPTKATVLSVSESLERWKAVASRNNTNLENYISSRSLEFIDVLQHAPPPLDSVPSPTPTLKPIFDLVIQSINTDPAILKAPTDETSNSNLVILDDISSLEWIGYTFEDLARFVRALRAACIKANTTLIIRHHRVSDDVAGDNLFAHLYQMCTYHLEVRALASGRSGSVSGEIALHPGPATIPSENGVNLLPRSCAMQYRLTDTSAVFFEKGTGGAVL